MKDYELDKKKKGLFILNYEVKGNKIIVNYANGDAVSIPNTLENEKKLNDKMITQVQNSDSFLARCKANFTIYTFLVVLGVIMCIPALIALNSSLVLFSLGKQILLGFGCGTIIISESQLFIINKYFKDIKKNNEFLRIKDELNVKVAENIKNENILYKTHNITKNIIKNADENKVVFTINNIEKVPFSDLDQIMSNIKREEKFNFEYPVVVEEEKSKKKTK